MLDLILKVLTLSAFQARNDDPNIPFTRKVEGREFIVVILGHQHVKYAAAKIRNKKLILGRPITTFCENFQTSEVDTPWVAEMLAEIHGIRTVLIGVNCLFSNLKIYPRDQKFREILTNFSRNREAEVGKTFEKQTQYFLSQAGNQVSLNGVEREKILRPIEKFRKWGFTVVGVFHYPTAIISRISAMPLDWENPGILVYYSQKLIFFAGWHKGEMITLRSRLIAEASRGATGTRPTLNTIQKEIDVTTQMVESKAGSPVANIYTYHDRQDQTFAGLESTYKNARAIVWPQDGIVSDMHPYSEPDLAIIREINP